MGAHQTAVKSIRIVRGLELPISGPPDHAEFHSAGVSRVGVLGEDFNGLRPALNVKEGDQVKLGQPLFTDRRKPEIQFTSPGPGRVRAITRGPKRALKSIVIDLDETVGEETFPSWPSARLPSLRSDQIKSNLLASGLWTALRTRPFGRRADPGCNPAAIFVTAIDSNPLAARAEQIIDSDRNAFADGVTAVSKLTPGDIYICQEPRAQLPVGECTNAIPVRFAGPHPAGLPGTHIHFLCPVSAGRTAWHINYQDVIAIGKLFTTGRLPVDRIISVAGPAIMRPRLVRTRLGASIDDLVEGERTTETCRVISGSVLSGRTVAGETAFLGRFHNQITALPEEDHVFTPPYQGSRWGWFSTYIRSVIDRPPANRFPLTTARNGATAPLIPLEGYERVMPLDILPAPLMRALLVGDMDMAIALGCLELDEEDLALCSFVCPSKINHGLLLREMLDRIEREQ